MSQCWIFLRRVSTHSRPKAAGFFADAFFLLFLVSTHSRPKAAGNLFGNVVT